MTHHPPSIRSLPLHLPAALAPVVLGLLAQRAAAVPCPQTQDPNIPTEHIIQWPESVGSSIFGRTVAGDLTGTLTQSTVTVVFTKLLPN